MGNFNKLQPVNTFSLRQDIKGFGDILGTIEEELGTCLGRLTSGLICSFLLASYDFR